MNISPLTGYRANFTFGYNKKFHKDIQKRLSAESSIHFNMLAKIDKNLLAQERKITALEHLGLVKNDSYLSACEDYIKAKRNLAKQIDDYDIRLQYSQSLINQYKDEISKTKSIAGRKWRSKLYAGLKVDLENKKEGLKTKLENQIERITGGSKTSSGNKSQNKEEDISELIPLYVPNEHSPKGFFDVIGSNDIKDKLQDDLIPYVLTPEQRKTDYEEYGIRAPRGFLFYGPPGCGKTYMTKALSSETGMPMYTMDVSKVGSKWVNKSANNVRDAFEYIFNKASISEKPVILFMDEVDSLAFERSSNSVGSQEDSKVVTTLLKMVEAARDNNVVVIAATNRYDILDSAFKDRFDGQIYFPLPDEEQIESLLTTSLISRSKGLELGYNEEQIKELSKMLLGFSNRAIVQIVDDSAKLARKRSRDNIKFEDIKTIIETTGHEKIKEKLYKQNSKNPTIGFGV